MKGNEKYIEGFKFVSLFVGFVCSYITWIGLGSISNQMFTVLSKLLPISLLILFVLTIPALKKMDWFFAGSLLVLVAIPAFFYFNNFPYLIFYWQVPLSLVFIFLVGKFSFGEASQTILLYFSGGYVATSFIKLLMVKFDIGNLVLWTNKNLIGGSTFFACMLAIVLIDKMDIDYSLLLQGLISLSGITLFYLCDSWTPLVSFLTFLVLGSIFKYSSLVNRVVSNKILWVMLFSALFLLMPVIIYILTMNDGFGFSMSGRIPIWQELFYSWTANTNEVLFGMQGSFSAARTGLAAHNAYLDILWKYGIIGYMILFGGIVTLTFRHRQSKYSTNQILCLTAFLVICLHAIMENYLSSFQWIPMIFIFLALFVSQSEQASAELEEEDDLEEEDESEEAVLEEQVESEEITEVSAEKSEEVLPE